jgi:hypothetical protein
MHCDGVAEVNGEQDRTRVVGDLDPPAQIDGSTECIIGDDRPGALDRFAMRGIKVRALLRIAQQTHLVAKMKEESSQWVLTFCNAEYEKSAA